MHIVAAECRCGGAGCPGTIGIEALEPMTRNQPMWCPGAGRQTEDPSLVLDSAIWALQLGRKIIRIVRERIEVASEHTCGCILGRIRAEPSSGSLTRKSEVAAAIRYALSRWRALSLAVGLPEAQDSHPASWSDDAIPLANRK